MGSPPIHNLFAFILLRCRSQGSSKLCCSFAEDLVLKHNCLSDFAAMLLSLDTADSLSRTSSKVAWWGSAFVSFVPGLSSTTRSCTRSKWRETLQIGTLPAHSLETKLQSSLLKVQLHLEWLHNGHLSLRAYCQTGDAFFRCSSTFNQRCFLQLMSFVECQKSGKNRKRLRICFLFSSCLLRDPPAIKNQHISNEIYAYTPITVHVPRHLYMFPGLVFFRIWTKRFKKTESESENRIRKKIRF